MTFREATAEFSCMGGVWIVMFVSNPTKIVVKATLLLSVGVTYVKFENLKIWTMPQMAAPKVWIFSIPILKVEVSNLILISGGLDLLFEGNIGWEKSENMDWLF